MFLLDSLHTPQQRYLSHCYNYSPTNLCSRLALWITISSDGVLSILPSPVVSSDGSRETYRYHSSVEAVVQEGKLSYSDAWLTLTSCCDVGEAKELLTLVFSISKAGKISDLTHAVHTKAFFEITAWQVKIPFLFHRLLRLCPRRNPLLIFTTRPFSKL